MNIRMLKVENLSNLPKVIEFLVTQRSVSIHNVVKWTENKRKQKLHPLLKYVYLDLGC